jgi:hypothetical protein
MISIVISSYRENHYELLLKNIQRTIGGANYEIVKINNPGLMGISKAYNEGANKAQYNTLLFIHEDIQFLTNGWGNILIESLKTENLGILGVAGGTRKFNLPTGHDQGIDADRRLFVKHHKSESDKHIFFRDLEPVKTLDGVFLAMSKLTWEKIKFNEAIDGFHFYDMDISLRTSEILQNYVTSNISILHFSRGGFNNEWLNASIKFHKKNYNFDEASKLEKSITTRFWLERLLYEDISFKNRLKYIYKIGVEFKSFKKIINFILAKKFF